MTTPPTPQEQAEHGPTPLTSCMRHCELESGCVGQCRLGVIADLTRRLTAANQRVSELSAALRELVACKDLKEATKNGVVRSPYPDYDRGFKQAVAEYERRKGPAWEAARTALGADKETANG